MRKSVADGKFYPEDESELREKVGKYLVSKRENIKIAFCPHAGYAYSGKLAGKIISMIPDKKDIIILGVNHSGLGNKISFSKEDFSTPLGVVKNNNELGHRIFEKLKHADLDVDVNEEAHNVEHSIEVQLPFLQVSQKKEMKIVPILLKDLKYEECEKVAEVLKEFLRESEFILISGDMTHYGPLYNFVPEGIEGKDLDNYDKLILLEALKKDSKGFYHKAEKSTICGIYGSVIGVKIAELLNLDVELVDYYTSGDITKDYENVVGYGGVVMK
ncbi:MAG: AmmeMemoRadiSam system protein B [Nanoarchaeota archaeon]|nr:AmmeMemoRadiSam system protein B [Nanoarchaeota archaeon]